MSEINSIANGTFTIGSTSANDSSLLVTQNEGNVSILQDTVATSAGIVGDGTTQNPLRTDETVLWSGHISAGEAATAYSLSEPISAFDSYRVYWLWNEGTNCAGVVSEFYWDEDRPTKNNFTLFSVNRFSNANFSALGLFEVASNLKDITYTYSQQNTETFKFIKIKKIVGINRKA